MNEVRITGTIASDIDARSRPDGTESCSALLQFHKSNGPVLLFCLEERAHKLARFKSGDLVSVRGRLTINPLNAKAAILVDEVQHLDARKESAEDREGDVWNATRRFQANARVANTRWAKRPGWQR